MRDDQVWRMIILYAIISCNQPLFTLYFAVWEILLRIEYAFHSISMPLPFTSLSLLFALSPPISLSFSLSDSLPFLILIICVCRIFYKKSVTPIFWPYFFLTHSFIILIIYLFSLTAYLWTSFVLVFKWINTVQLSSFGGEYNVFQ